MGSCCGKSSTSTNQANESESSLDNDGVPSMKHIENEVLARSATFSRAENINKSIEC